MTLGNWLALFVALVTAAEVVRALRHRALRRDQWGRRFFRLRTTSWGLGILMFMVIVALVAPLIAPFAAMLRPGGAPAVADQVYGA